LTSQLHRSLKSCHDVSEVLSCDGHDESCVMSEFIDHHHCKDRNLCLCSIMRLKKYRELYTKAPSTRIRKFVKTQIFFYEYGLRPHVSSVFSGRIRKFLKTLSRVEIFLSDTNSYTCGRSYPQICEYAYVIFLNPVFTSSIINKHGVQQGCIFFVNCSDF